MTLVPHGTKKRIEPRGTNASREGRKGGGKEEEVSVDKSGEHPATETLSVLRTEKTEKGEAKEEETC